jgi:hypothetical protein
MDGASDYAPRQALENLPPHFPGEKKENLAPAGRTFTHMHAPKLLHNKPLQALHAGLFLNRHN